MVKYLQELLKAKEREEMAMPILIYYLYTQHQKLHILGIRLNMRTLLIIDIRLHFAYKYSHKHMR